MVNRKTLVANTETTFDFDLATDTATIKNFTSDYILVGVDTFVESKAYKIPSMTAQKITTRSNKIIVKPATSGEVEIDA